MKFFIGLSVLLAIGCCKVAAQGDRVTIRPYHEGWCTDAQDPIVAAFQRMQKPEIPGIELNTGWHWVLGQEGEKLVAIEIPTTGGKPIQLPHRILQPDRAIWYTQTLDLSEQSYCIISADDGAQLFVNGKQVPRLEGNIFKLPMMAKAAVSVRVLNNAMEGGLRSVRMVRESDFLAWRESCNAYERVERLAKKQILLGDETTRFYVAEAVARPTPKNIEIAESCFKGYPLLVGPWITRHGKQTWISVWAEPEYPVALWMGNDSLPLQEHAVQQGEVLHFELGDQATEKFWYRLQSGNVATSVYRVQLSDQTTQPFSFWADSQSGWHVFGQHLSQQEWQHDAFTVGVGDLVGNGSDRAAWQHFFGLLSTHAAKQPVYLVPGNHDYDGYADELRPLWFQKLVPRRPVNYFSWYAENCGFIALDPNENFPIGVTPGSSQYEWLRKELESDAWHQADWRFIMIHQTLYSQGWAGYQGDKVLRNLLEPLLEKAKVDVVVSGHTHDYERLTRKYGNQWVTYMVLGGAGGPLEPEASSAQPVMDKLVKTYHIARVFVDDSQLRWEVRNLEGKMIDQFALKKMN